MLVKLEYDWLNKPLGPKTRIGTPDEFWRIYCAPRTLLHEGFMRGLTGFAREIVAHLLPLDDIGLGPSASMAISGKRRGFGLRTMTQCWYNAQATRQACLEGTYSNPCPAVRKGNVHLVGKSCLGSPHQSDRFRALYISISMYPVSSCLLVRIYVSLWLLLYSCTKKTGFSTATRDYWRSIRWNSSSTPWTRCTFLFSESIRANKLSSLSNRDLEPGGVMTNRKGSSSKRG